MKPLLSVIIPVYNTEQYLRECVDCVLNQSMDGIEIILIDDGSSDNSGAICDEYVKTHINVKVIHKHNEGLGLTRNCGIDAAKGEYVAFIDSDDRISNDYFENLYTCIKKSDSDICYSGGFVNFNRTKQNTITFAVQDGMMISGHENLKQCMLRSISTDVETNDLLPISACMALYRVAFLRSNNIRFLSERTFISEDLWFNLDCLNKASRVFYSTAIGYMYRYNETSLSRGYKKERFELLYSSIEQLIKRCEYFGLENYLGRVAMYYWVNFEKCINQEVRYNKNFFASVNKIEENIRNMCDLQYSEVLLKKLEGNNFSSIPHRLLCRLLVKKKYKICILLLKLYNCYKH